MDEGLKLLLEMLSNKLDASDLKDIKETGNGVFKLKLPKGFDMNALIRNVEAVNKANGHSEEPKCKCGHVACKTWEFFADALKKELESKGKAFQLTHPIIVQEYITDLKNKQGKQQAIKELVNCNVLSSRKIYEGKDKLEDALMHLTAAISGRVISDYVISEIREGKYDEYFIQEDKKA